MSTTLRKGRAGNGASRVTGRGRLRVAEANVSSWSHRALSLATLATVVVLLALLAWIAWGAAGASRAARRAASAHLYPPSIQEIDPRLIVHPHTVTQVAVVDGLDLTLAVNPVLPGPNRVVVALADHGRVLAGARIRVVATMPGMLMRPVQVVAREERSGRYVGMGALPMFGRWQVAVRVERPRAAPLVHVFAVTFDLPVALLQAVVGTRDHAGR